MPLGLQYCLDRHDSLHSSLVGPSLAGPSLTGLDDPTRWAQRKAMTPRKSSLDDPDYAMFAWRRYKRLMWWMALASIGATIFCLWLLYLMIGLPTWQMALAMGGGVFVSVLLAGALMGLVFLSAGTGHDNAIEDPFEDEA
jgi:hypothetical protein